MGKTISADINTGVILLPTKIHTKIMNEATGVDFITVTKGYSISYNMLEKWHKRAVIKPKTIAITMPKLILPRENRQLIKKSFVIKS